MNFGFNEDQLAMREAAMRVFSDMSSDQKLKQLTNTRAASSMHTELWSQLADMGILGLVIDQAYGGMGMSLLELCLVLEQQGRTVAPVPLLATIVESAMTIAAGDNELLKQEILPKVIDGDALLSPCGSYAGIQSVDALWLASDAEGVVLSGRSGFASYAGLADGFVVSGLDANDQNIIVYLPANAEGLSVVEQVAINDEPAGYLVFENCKANASNIIARGELAASLVEQQNHRAWVAQGAMQTGILDEGLKRAAEYVSERKQFGKTLGSFQAVSQQAANAYMEIESLRSTYWRALDDLEQGNDLALSASVLKYWVGIASHNAAHAFLHLHGGIGQDLEYPLHRYFLWAKQNERYLGAPDKLASIVGDVVINKFDDVIGAG